jgi:hypothetical protein
LETVPWPGGLVLTVVGVAVAKNLTKESSTVADAWRLAH